MFVNVLFVVILGLITLGILLFIPGTFTSQKTTHLLKNISMSLFCLAGLITLVSGIYAVYVTILLK